MGTVASQSLVLVFIYTGVRKAKLKKGEENVCFIHNLEILSFLNRGGGGGGEELKISGERQKFRRLIFILITQKTEQQVF